MHKLRTRLPPVNSLVAFEAAARHLSFTVAARELHVTQGAVSRQVRSLESNLGIALFHRAHRSVRLTREGQRLHHAVGLSLEHIASACAELRTVHSQHQVTIAATLAFSSLWLVSRLPRFREADPEIDVRVLATDQELDYATEAVDLAVRYGKGGWPEVAAVKLLDEEVFPVCSPAFLDRHGPIATAQELARARLLNLDRNQWRWLGWPDWFRRLGHNVRLDAHGLWLSNYPLVIQAAVAGQGIALGWRHLVGDHLAAGLLVRPLDLSLTTDMSDYLVLPSDLAPAPAVLAFRDWLLAEAGVPMPGRRIPTTASPRLE